MPVITVTADNFDKEVLQSEKPVLLDFWASWCGPCMMLSPTVHEIADEHPEIKVGKINVDEQPDLAREFGIRSIPALFVIKNGEVTNRALGVRPKQSVLDLLN